MTEAAYARHRGVARKTVTMWKSKGLLVLAEGGIHVKATDEIMDARPRHYKGGTTNRGPGAKEPPPYMPEPSFTDLAHASLSEAQRRKECALAATRELALLRLQGRIVDVEDIQPGWLRVVISVRSAMLAVPGRLRLKLPHLTDADIEGSPQGNPCRLACCRA